MAISVHNYNSARQTLVSAGSKTAEKYHVKHTKGKGSPEGHGKDLLTEARDEFRGLDSGQGNLVSGMTQAHYNAIHKASDTMDISNW